MPKTVIEKCGKLCITSILSSKRDITSTKIDANWRHSNLICSTVEQSHMKKGQINLSKHVKGKCEKLCIYSILTSKRGITPTKIDAHWRHLNLICSTLQQSQMLNFSSICQQFVNDLKIFKMEIQNASTTPSKSFKQPRNVNTVRWESRNITTQAGGMTIRNQKSSRLS